MPNLIAGDANSERQGSMKILPFQAAWFYLLICAVWGAEAQQAPAAITVLVSATDVKLAADANETRTSHMEIRASNDAAALQLGQTSITYDSQSQTLDVIEAHTLKSDGTKLPVEPSAIFDQAPQQRTGLLVTGLRAKLIVFPQFGTGDTAVYTVKINTKHQNFPGQFLEAQLFFRSQALNDVRETITAPKTLPLYIESHDVEFNKREDGANVIYSWNYSNPRPTAKDVAGPTLLEQTPRFFASTLKDYSELGRAYAALAEPKRVVTPKIQALADSITAKAADPKTQAQKLYEWVAGHIRYVGIELGTGSFLPHDVDTIVANGYGDCKDHDILLQALLKAKGIEAHSILINSGDTYVLPDIPTFVVLDHVITYVPKLDLYLDSSVGVAPFGILPFQEYGKPMVVASSEQHGRSKVPVLAAGVAKVSIQTNATVDKDGQVSGSTVTTASGPYAISLKIIGLGIQAVGPDTAAKLLTASGYDNSSGAFTVEPPTGFADDYTISATFKWSGWGDYLAGKNSFYMPPGVRLLGQTGNGAMGPLDETEMSKATDTIVCFNSYQKEDLSLTAPPSYEFNGMKDLRVETPNLVFTAHWSQNGQTLTVHREFNSKTDEPLCTGTVRAKSAAALKQISDSYNTDIFFSKPDAASANAAKASVAYKSGLAHFNAGAYASAIADMDTAIALQPNVSETYVARAEARLKLKQYRGALEDLNKAVTLAPSNIPYLFTRGFAHHEAGEYQLAIADFDRVIEKDPKNSNAFLFRGDSKTKLGQKKDGDRDIAMAAKLDPKLK